MKHETIVTLTCTFESHAQETDGDVEFWLARDLQHLLGYTKWDNFLNVVSKAKTACEVSEHEILDHFADVGKMVDLGSGSQREIDEQLPPAEDVKKVERRLASEEKKSLKNPDSLGT